MSKLRKFSTIAALVTLALTVSACGEGGVNSTPTPTPTPTPPPAGANTSLLAPLVSETFVNDATTASGTFPNVSNLATGPATLTISYDQTNQSYTIQTQGRSQSFAPANRDASQSTAEQTTYKKVNGTTTDLLTLTNPGTAGHFLYKYAGAGFWQRSISSTTSVTGSFDAFTYGVATPASAVPRSGSGSYDFDVVGVLARASGIAPYGMGGTGSMNVDFAASQFSASGNVTLVDSTSGATVDSARIEAQGSVGSGNSLTGSFVYDPTGTQYVGRLNGRFYGPNADEFGAAVFGTAQNQAFPGVLSAALIGRKGAAGSGSNLSLLSLGVDQAFPTKAAHIRQTTDPVTGKVINTTVQDPFQFTGGGGIVPQLAYTASSNSYAISDAYQGGFANGTYGAAQAVNPQPDARFTEYRTTNGNDGTVLKLYKPGAGNPELVLTYSSYGIWDQTSKPAADGSNVSDKVYFTYGIPSTAFPRTGTANYTGIVRGSAGSTVPGTDPYDVAGSFNFTFDFGLDNLSGTFSPTLVNLATGAQSSPGIYQITNTRGPQAGGQIFDGYLTMTGAAQSTGSFRGGFFGPSVNEIAGTWVIREADPAGVGQYFNMTGAFIGRKN